MKIIRKDNFDRDTVSEHLIAENVSPFYGRIIVEALNEELSGDNAPDYFKLVPDSHKLYTYEP